MRKLFLKEPTTVTTLEEKEILLTNKEYNLSNEKLAIKNGFYKCQKCKNYFDEVSTSYDKLAEDVWYCEECFKLL